MSEDQSHIASHEKRKRHHWYFYPGIILAAAVIAAAGLLCFMTVTEYKPAPEEPALSGGNEKSLLYGGDDFRILSFNTGYASLGEDADFLMDGGKGSGMADAETIAVNVEGIENILTEADADIYMLQEVDLSSHRTGHINHVEEYASVLPSHEWHYAPNFRCSFVPYPLKAPIGNINSGVATYSRYHADESVRISLPVPFSWPVRTANLKRCLLASWIPIENTDAELVIVNFHLEAYDDGEGKEAQTNQLLDMIEKEYEKGNYVIAGGDFNQIFPLVETYVKPTSEWVPTVLPELPEDMEGWRYVYDDSTPTCRLLNQPHIPGDELTQYYVIDGFIISPNIEVENVKTVDQNFRFSDHNPVMLDVSLR